MSVQEQIDRINQNVANTYSALSALGADMPEEQNSDNLAATAAAIKAVLYIAQTLTEAQKAQARANIGAADAVAADTVTADGTIAVSGAAVAAYVDVRVAQLGLYVLIIEQPVPITVNDGATATFVVAAEGKGLTYQWQYMAPTATDWVNSGATGAMTAKMSFQARTYHDGYMYRCVIMDAKGNIESTESVKLTVIAELRIDVQPENVTVREGETAIFSVKATGNGLSYQWQYCGLNTTEWNNSGAYGATTATLSFIPSVSLDGFKYRCVITDNNGNSVISDEVTLTFIWT